MQVQDLEELLAAVKAAHPDDDLTRLEDNLAAFVKGDVRQSPDPVQRPRFWYAGLPDNPWPDPNHYPQLQTLEANYAAIRQDLERVLAEPDRQQRFRGGEAQEMADYIRGALSIFYFRDHFAPDEEQARMQENRAFASDTAAVLDSLPRLGETAFFSIIGPDTHLRPHYGAENLRAFVHLGMIIPEGCAIKVAGREQRWEEGKAFVFDDSYEHEAWNRGTAVRTILLVEFWHHDLNDAEILFFQRFTQLQKASSAA